MTVEEQGRKDGLEGYCKKNFGQNKNLEMYENAEERLDYYSAYRRAEEDEQEGVVIETGAGGYNYPTQRKHEQEGR